MRVPLILLLLAGSSAGAVDNGWLRSGGVYNYTDAANWAGGQVNDLFSASLTVDHTLFLRFSDNYTAQQGLTFEGTLDNLLDQTGSTYSLEVYLAPISAGKIFTLGGDIYLKPKVVTGDSAPQFIFSDQYDFRIDLGGSDRTFHVDDVILWTSGGVQRQGGITKTGTGTLRLLGDNTFTGGVDHKQGTLYIESAASLGAGPLKLGHGTKLIADNSTSPAVTNEVFLNGEIRIAGYSLPRFAGAIHLGPSTPTIIPDEISGYGVEFSGIVSGEPGVGLTIGQGKGAHLTLSGQNTYDGNTTVLAGGLLAITHKNALGTGKLILTNGGGIRTQSSINLAGTEAIANPVELDGAQVIFGDLPGSTNAQLEFTSPIHLKNLSQSLVMAGQRTIFSGDISGAPGTSIIVDRKSDTERGTLVLNGVNTTDGGMTIRSSLSVASARSLGTGTLAFEDGFLLVTAKATGDGAIRNQVHLRGQAYLLGSGPTEFSGGVVVDSANAGIQLGSLSDVTLSGPLTGLGSTLTLSGDGILRLNAAGTYSGGSVLKSGVRLYLGNSAALGTGTISIEGPALIQATTSLKGATAVANDVSVKSNFTVRGAEDLEFAGSVDLGTATRKLTLENTALTSISGVIRSASTTAGLTKTGPMSLRLSGLNTYTGPTRVEAGRLLVGADAPKGGPGALGNATSPVTLYGGGSLIIDGPYTVARDITVDFDTKTQNIGSKGASLSSFTGNIILNGPLAVTSETGGTVQISGVVSGGRPLSLSGAGSVVVTNANTYTGGTTVSSGTLRIANISGSATGTGAVSVTRGTLAGAGSISGALTVGNGSGTADALLAPGIGLGLMSAGAITLNTDAVFQFEFDSINGVSDLLRSAGPVSLTNPKLVMLHLSPQILPLGFEFLLIENLSINETTGQFAGLPQGADLQMGENFFRLDYQSVKGSDGVANDIVLRVVPEPTTGSLLVSGLLLGRLFLRRRRLSGAGFC